MRWIATAALIGLSAMLASAPGAAAAGGWSAPHELAGAQQRGQIAVDAFGTVLAAWTDGAGTVRAAWRPPGGTFGPPQSLGAASPDHNHVAVLITPRGEAVVAWTAPGRRVLARWGLVGEDFATAQDVAAGWMPRLAADGHGTIVLAWHSPVGDRPSPHYVAERPLGGRFGPAREFGGEAGWGSPELAMNLAGHAALAWLDSPHHRVWLATRSPTGEWGPAERVPFGYESMMGALLGVDETGDTLVAGSPFAGGPYYRASVVRRHPSGQWRPEETVDADGTMSRLAVQPSGAATFLFQRRIDDTPRYAAVARVLQADGAYGAPQEIGEDAMWGDVAAGPSGAVVATLWRGRRQPGEMLVTERQEGTPFDEPVALASGEVYPGTPAVSASGAAAASWLARADGAYTFNVSVRDAPFGLVAAAQAHLAVLGETVDPVVAVEPVPRLPQGAPSVPAAVTCSETCDVSATVSLRGARVSAAATTTSVRLGPGRPTRVRARIGGALRRAVRRRAALGRRTRLRLSVRARGYSQRTATQRRTVAIRPSRR